MTDNNLSQLELIRQIHDRVLAIDGKLDDKCDKDDCEKLEDRVGDVESKTERLAVKQAGIAASMSAVGIWIKAQFFG